MSTIYNGYGPGESRTVKMRKHKGDKGHSLLSAMTTRRGSAFAFNYRWTCECGRTFGSRQSSDRCYYAYAAHLRAEGVEY